MSGFQRTAIRLAAGTTEIKISSPLTTSSVIWMDSPVTFPPGLARLATGPLATGSACTRKTMGIEDVALFRPCT